MATPKQNVKKDPAKIFVVIPTSDLKDIENGNFSSIEPWGSGKTAEAAVEEANADIVDNDTEDADMVVVELHVVSARPLYVESKLVL